MKCKYLSTDGQIAVITEREDKGINQTTKSNKGWENIKKESYEERQLSEGSQKQIKLKTRQLSIMAKIDYDTTYSRAVRRRFKQNNKGISFITLTLPAKQNKSDNEIKRDLLNQFLIEMQKVGGIDLYIWRAEVQGNGNIHFHIIVNKLVNWVWVRRLWNRIVEKDGYNMVSNYSQRMKEFFKNGFKLQNDKRSIEQQKKAYNTGVKCGFTDPNSTDVKILKNAKEVEAYLSKYMSKENASEENRRGIKGKLWGCSRELSVLKKLCINLDELEATNKKKFEEIWDELQNSKKIEKDVNGFMLTIYCNIGKWVEIMRELINSMLETLIKKGYASLQ
jgi:hypothetical protein